MREIKADIWDYHRQGDIIVIPTNGFVKNNGHAVMGRGLALEASRRFKSLSYDLGTCIKMLGQHVVWWPEPMHLYTFPVKHNWWEKADPRLIRSSMIELMAQLGPYNVPNVYMPRVGCGNGQLHWGEVETIIQQYADERIIIIDRSL